METEYHDVLSRFVHVLYKQPRSLPTLPCPLGHHGRMFQSVDQLYDHAKTEHASHIANLKPSQAKEKLILAAFELR